MILCDTNILIEFYKGNPAVIQSLKQLGQDNIAVSIITKAELFYGARDKTEFARIDRHLSTCHCYGLNKDISDAFLGLMRHYSLSHKVSIPDMLIAATALTNAIEIYTLNIKDFIFIPNLKFYKA